MKLPQPVFAPDAQTAPPSLAGGETPPASTTPGAGGAPPQMPEGLPAQFWDAQSGQVNMGEFIKAHGELATFKQKQDERAATLPKSAADYKLDFKLPETVKLPDGAKIEINDKDPRWPKVQEFAHKHGISQEAVGELLTLQAVFEAESWTAAAADIQAQMKALGENGPARVKAAEDFLKASLSKDEYEAVRPFIGNATAFAGLEKIIAKATTQGVPPNGGAGNNPPPKPPVRMADRFYGQRTN